MKKMFKSDELKSCWLEAFKTGPVTDMAGVEHNFSESDLADLNEGIQNQLKSGYQPPLVKGHPKLDEPRVGSVVDSKVEDGTLKVKVDDVNGDFVDEVRKGGFKYLSSAIYNNLKKGLRHLGALGAVAPAMKGMSPICFGEGCFAEQDNGVTEKDVVFFAEKFAWDSVVPRTVFEMLVWRLQHIGAMFRSQREQMIEAKGIEAADKVFPEHQIKDLENVGDVLKNASDFPHIPSAPKEGASAEGSFAEDPDGAGAEGKGGEGAQANNEDPAANVPPGEEPTGGNGAEGNSSEAERLRELEAENAALKAKLEAQETEKNDAARKADFAAFSEKLETLAKEGRLNQGMKDHFLKVFSAVQAVPVDGEGCFGEGEDRFDPKKLLNEALDAMPVIVEFGEHVPSGHSAESAAVRISNYYSEQHAKGRNISFAEAASESFK